MLKTLTEQFFQQGFVLLPKPLPAAIINNLLHEFQNLLRGIPDSGTRSNRIALRKHNSENGIQAHLPTAALRQQPAISKTLLSFLGSPLINQLIVSYLSRFYQNKSYQGKAFLHDQIDLELNGKPGKTNNSMWHFDRVPSIKCSIYLHQVGPKDGPLHIIPGSHFLTRKLAYESLQKNPDPMHIDNYLKFTQEPPSTCLQVPAGTVVLFDTFAVHKGGEIIGSGHRTNIRTVTWPPILNQDYLSYPQEVKGPLDSLVFQRYHPFDRQGQYVKDPRHVYRS